MNGRAPKLAYLFPTFPVFHQTFVLFEVLALQHNGIDLHLYSLRRPNGPQQPEGQDVARQVTYLPGLLSAPVLRANWRRARSDFRRYCRAYLSVCRAWRTGPAGPVRDQQWGRGHINWRNRIRGWYNTSPLLYLLKSLLVVPTAVYLAEELERSGITHLHAHWASYPATIAYVVHVISDLPFSISAHAYDIYMVPRMLPTKLRAARFTVTCAETNARFLRQLGGEKTAEKVIVNYHGVDVGRFAPAAANRHASAALRIVSCGQLERYKGMHALVAACAEVIRQGIAVECAIVGEGVQRPVLEAQIERLGLRAHVRLLGARPQAEVASLLQQADLFVLASELAGKFGRRDVIANVVVEAMAAGLPVIATHIPGVEELVEHGVSGYLIPPNSTEAISRAIATLAADADTRARLGRASRRRIVQDFDRNKNVLRLAELLNPMSADAALPQARSAYA